MVRRSLHLGTRVVKRSGSIAGEKTGVRESGAERDYPKKCLPTQKREQSSRTPKF